MKKVLQEKIFKVGITSVVVSGAIVLSLSSAHAAGRFQPVYSFKNLGEFTNPSGQEYTKLLVTCNGDPDPRYIQREKGQKLWCIDGDASSCSKERIETATTACTTPLENSATQVAAETTPTAPKISEEDKRKTELRNKLVAEQLALEQKRIEIKSRQIELQQLELKLSSQRGQ